MTEKHTQGRLQAGVSTYQGVLSFTAVSEGNEQKIIALCGLAGASDELESIANTLRLAACWNYCEGLDAEGMGRAVEMKRPAKVFIDESIKKELALLAQRKELLEALGHIARMTNDGYAERHARDAIAQAGGAA